MLQYKKITVIIGKIRKLLKFNPVSCMDYDLHIRI
jgi:hypothetical protein